ncbi:MAG: hypothetical protein WCJ58_03510 [bacterium]
MTTRKLIKTLLSIGVSIYAIFFALLIILQRHSKYLLLFFGFGFLGYLSIILIGNFFYFHCGKILFSYKSALPEISFNNSGFKEIGIYVRARITVKNSLLVLDRIIFENQDIHLEKNISNQVKTNPGMARLGLRTWQTYDILSNQLPQGNIRLRTNLPELPDNIKISSITVRGYN